MFKQKAALPLQPLPRLQLVINERQVSLRDVNQGDPLYDCSLSHGYTRRPYTYFRKPNDPLILVSDTFMNNVDWKVFEPPRELVPENDTLHDLDRYGIPELKTLLATSIDEVGTSRALEEYLRRTAAQPSRTVNTVPVTERMEESGSSNTSVAGPSRPNLITTATDTDVSNIQQQTRPISQESTQTNASSDSGYITATERNILNSRSMPTQQGYSKLSPFARLKKLLSKRKSEVKGKSVVREPTGECVSCLDDFPEQEMVHVKCHEYCKGCFERLVIAAINTEMMWPVKCCMNEIPHKDILNNIKTALARDFRLKAAEREVPSGDRIYCMKPGCETWIPPKSVNKGLKCASCPTCKTRVCITCRGPWHKGKECPQDKDLQATVMLAAERGWKQCYKCNAFVELARGCRHITCRCKAEWCYVCLAKWQTCGCTDVELCLILQEIETRRQVKAHETELHTRLQTLQVRLDADRIRPAAKEERSAVRMVEDFERKQAEKGGTEAERQFSVEEDIRRGREGTRVPEIALSFERMREGLEILHLSQKSLFTTRSRKEFQIIEARDKELEELNARHSRETEQLKAEYEAKKSKQELIFQNDYNECREEEIRVWEENMKKLEVLWKDNPNSVYEIRAAKDLHQEKCNTGFGKWDSYRKTVMHKLAQSFESENKTLSWSHVEQRYNFRSALANEWRDWARRKVAEVKWFEAVITERESMLQMLEAQLYARATAESEVGRAS